VIAHSFFRDKSQRLQCVDSSVVERLVYTELVGGSNPSPRTIFLFLMPACGANVAGGLRYESLEELHALVEELLRKPFLHGRKRRLFLATPPGMMLLQTASLFVQRIRKLFSESSGFSVGHPFPR